MIKLIVSDLEETLLNSDYEILPTNLEAIQCARNKGKQFILCTSRNMLRISQLLAQSKLKCHKIVMDGALYLNENDKVIKEVFMKQDAFKEASDALIELGLCFQCDSDHGIYASHDEKSLMKAMVQVQMLKMSKPNGKMAQALIERNHFIEDVQPFHDLEQTNAKFYRIECFSNNPILIRDALNRLDKIEGIYIHRINEFEFTITDAMASWKQMLKKACLGYDVSRYEVMCLGGTLELSELLEEYPNCYAMENAPKELKTRAPFITASNKISGVAKAIYLEISNDTKPERDRENLRMERKIARREEERALRFAQLNVDNGVATEADLELLKQKEERDLLKAQRALEKREGKFKPREEGSFERREGGFKPREGFKPRGEGSSERREGGFKPREGFKPRGEGSSERREGGFKPREGFKPRGEGSSERREGGFKPREGFKPRGEGSSERREGGFKPREGFKPRGEGSSERREGGFKPREGFKPRGEGSSERREGGFKPREGFKPRGEGSSERREGGFKPREGFKPRGEGSSERREGGFKPREGFKPRGEGSSERREGGFKPREGFKPKTSSSYRPNTTNSNRSRNDKKK